MGGKPFAFILTAAIILTTHEVPVLAEKMYSTNQTDISETVQSENQAKTPETVQSISQTETPAEQPGAETRTLPDDVLTKCIVPGMTPQGVIVNLFDYWQEGGRDPEKEVAHDYYEDYWDADAGAWKKVAVTTFNSGISRGHLLRFGYRANADDGDYCTTVEDNKSLGDYGAWNQYYQSYGVQQVSGDTGKLYLEIVKNKLGADGFPALNLANKPETEFGRYSDPENAAEGYLYHKEESLAYLFSPNVTNAYKEIHQNVQGLFQPGPNGSYYYNSTENFASYNSSTNSFILYNSPGVAKKADNSDIAEYCGQFFPFNKAEDVFDTYTVDANGNYHLTYRGAAQQNGAAIDNNDGNDSNNGSSDNGDPAIMDAANNGYIQCYAPGLNHYLGMTLEMRFLQPESGCLPDSDTPMTFEFSGDDDVWIFIDDVLVADLGGIHEAYSLRIDFSDGSVYIQKLGRQDTKAHTLLDSFKSAYGEESNPGGIEFNNNTFADNTVHTLKMFYLERGHMASNLSLNFNIQTLSYDQVEEADQDENEPQQNTDNNMVPERIGIPQTGDDSMIGWWAALCIASLLGVGATVYNLKRKK